MSEQTYWANQGTHQAFADKLEALVPASGAVSNPRGSNRKLEKFRQASNAYYDIFNNGGGNRGPLIRRIFDISVGAFTYGGRSAYRRTNWDGIHAVTEPVMDRIILEAAVEQKIITPRQFMLHEILGKLKTDLEVDERKELSEMLLAA